MKKIILKYGTLCLGLLMYAIAFNLFMLPYNFVVGGASGISIIIYNILGIDTSLTVSVVSIVLLICSFFLCSKSRTISALASTFLLPLFIKLTANINNYITLDISPLLSVFYCSVLVGISLGLIYKIGLSTGGTDIIYWILEKYVKKSIGKIMIMVEGTIILVGAFTFGFQNLMYSLIILFIMSTISDYITIGISNSKVIKIIPNDYEAVNDYLKSLSFVKKFNLTSDNGKKMIYCITSNSDYPFVYSGIVNIDKDVFLSTTNTYEVIGGLDYEK